MKKAEKTAVYGVFAAIIVVLQLLSYTLKIGTFNLSLVLIPIVFGAYLYGPKTGAVLGGIFGCILAILNFFFMAVGASLAADKAEKQDVKGGKGIVQTSMLLRYVFLFVILFALGKSGICNLFALVIPLVFVRPVLTVGEFFRKKGDQ